VIKEGTAYTSGNRGVMSIKGSTEAGGNKRGVGWRRCTHSPSQSRP
jgi:hypothetical protein